jgi:tetratricopeptide (TPR) repeat protein
MKEIKTLKDIIEFVKKDGKFLSILLIITFLAYANIIRGEFVTADDIPGIVQNPLIKDFWGAMQTLRLHIIKNAIIYQVAGMNPNAFHIVSVVSHLINIVLVYVFSRVLFKHNIARLTSIIFALHPVNAEAVMWISGGPYLIEGFCAMLVFIPFVMYEKTHIKKYLYASLGAYLFMVIGDSGAAWPLVVPFILGVIDQFLFSEKINMKGLVTLLLPFFLVAAFNGYLIYRNSYANRVGALAKDYYFNASEAPPLLNRIPFTTFMGIRNMVFPYELNIYPGERALTQGYVSLVNVVTLGFVALVAYLYLTNRIYTGLILAILASLAPTYSPIQIAWLMTERYMYLGSVFFAIILALLFTNLKEKNENIFKITFGLVLIFYFVRVVFRSEDWRTNKNLWLSTLVFSPDSYRVYNNLGDVYIKENDYDKAIESFKKSFEIFPGYADAMHNVGLVYIMKEDLPNAKLYMEMALKTKPTLVPAWEKMGIIYYQMGQYDIARAYFSKAVEIDPTAQLGREGLAATEELIRAGITSPK